MPWFDCAQKRPIGTNMGGTLSPNLGLILHHAVMNGSLFNFFNNPSSEVSAHFWVAQSGLIEQYVDTNVVAWHAKQLNTKYVGVETEGCVKQPHAEPMSPAMVNALAVLYAEGNRRHGWPFVTIDTDGERGFGFHRMAVNTACPCDVRLNRRQDILNIAQGPITPPVTPTGEEEDMGVSDAISWKGGQTSIFQVAGGVLWHKWSQVVGRWSNENVNSRAGVTVILKDNRPSVARLGNQIIITVERASDSRVFYFAQSEDSADWGVNELP
jgi:hypothetical protein